IGSCFGHRLCFSRRRQRRDMARFAYTAPPRDWMNRWGEDYAKALPYFEEAVQRTPRYAEAWFKVGVCNGELGRWHEAVTAVQQAIHLKPDDAEAYYNLGVAYGHLGHWRAAVAALQQAIHLKSDDAEAHLNLGVAYLILGDRDSALEEYTILKTLDQNLANDLVGFISYR